MHEEQWLNNEQEHPLGRIILRPQSEYFLCWIVILLIKRENFFTLLLVSAYSLDTQIQTYEHSLSPFHNRSTNVILLLFLRFQNFRQ